MVLWGLNGSMSSVEDPKGCTIYGEKCHELRKDVNTV